VKRVWFAALLAIAACKGGGEKKEHDEHGEGEHEEGEREEEGHDEEGHGGERVIHLNADQVKAAGIQTAKAAVRKEVAALEANGQIGAAEDRQARIGVRVPGRVTSLKAGVGDKVKKGQTLAFIESADLGGAKADYVAAKAAATLARETADREKQLYERKISSESEWRKAESEAVRAAAELQAAENRLHALGVSDRQLPDKVGHFSSTIGASTPIGGVVVERPVTLGEQVDPEDTLFLIMDLSEVWILVDVFERDLAQVSVGQKVKVSVTAYPEQEFAGEVSHIGAVVEPRSRAVKVRVALPNPDGRLKPGMFARVALSGTEGAEHEHLFVPVGAVQRTDGGAVVFVPGEEEGEFVPRAVRTGHEAAGYVAIESGLSPDEEVVVAGSFILKSELGKESLGESGHSH
jgi:cobalt-zinc-cadmium efflux system membrane fusion protein